MNTENNKLIVEFLGLINEPYYLPQHKTIEFKYGEYIEWEHFNANELKFHSDWNWLMEVVEKIESIKGTQIFINGISCEIMFKGRVISKHFNTKIEAVYNACVEFIKWYNENKV